MLSPDVQNYLCINAKCKLYISCIMSCRNKPASLYHCHLGWRRSNSPRRVGQSGISRPEGSVWVHLTCWLDKRGEFDRLEQSWPQEILCIQPLVVPGTDAYNGNTLGCPYRCPKVKILAAFYVWVRNLFQSSVMLTINKKVLSENLI